MSPYSLEGIIQPEFVFETLNNFPWPTNYKRDNVMPDNARFIHPDFKYTTLQLNQQRTDRRQWERPASELRKELDRCLGDPMSYSWGVTIFIAGNSHLLDVEDSASELNDLLDVEERDVSTHLHRSS